MKFEFAKYTEITDFVFKVKPELRDEKYVRFFICPDVWDFWFVRILEGFNEEYEQEEGSFLLERNNVGMERKGQTLNLTTLKRIILEEDGTNYDIIKGYDVESLVDMLDAGYGVLNRKELQNER